MDELRFFAALIVTAVLTSTVGEIVEKWRRRGTDRRLQPIRVTAVEALTIIIWLANFSWIIYKATESVVGRTN